MSKIYDSMTSALREHWKAHDNAYPQRFELMQSTLDTLVAHRKLINDTMNFKLNKGFSEVFMGVPIQVSVEGNALVAVDGTRVPLEA